MIGKDKNDAVQRGYKKYEGFTCSICGRNLYYTKSDQCVHCVVNDSSILHSLMNQPNNMIEIIDGQYFYGFGAARKPFDIHKYEPWMEVVKDANLMVHGNPTKICDKGHLNIKTLSGKCYLCSIEVSPRQQAINNGDKWYMPETPCNKCGQKALRRVNDGACECVVNRKTDRTLSPRQQAMAAGEKWYKPDTPCPRCGTTALRRVHDSVCQGCTGKPTERTTGRVSVGVLRLSVDALIRLDALCETHGKRRNEMIEMLINNT